MRLRSVLTPLLVVSVGVAASALLLQGRPATRSVESDPERPAVRVLEVRPETVRLEVRSQGTVAPRTQSDLVAEVPGRVLHIGPGLEAGAFFRAGDVLVELDPRDLELALGAAEASLARARAEEDFAKATLARQGRLRGEGIASEAILDETRRAARIAEARSREADVALERAARDLARTRIVAPFDGRTRERSVDIGRFVSVGTMLGRIYAVDEAEVRLPIPDADLAFLDLPLGQEIPRASAPQVVLEARFAGRNHRWTGHIVRTEAEIDPRTRMVHVVARVPRPYDTPQNAVRPPLAAGLFVEAVISGLRVEGVVRVPRGALANGRTLWVLDDQDRLRRRVVQVLRRERDSVLVVAGLDSGDRVSLSEPLRAQEGLAVLPVVQDAVAQRGPSPGPAS